MSSRAWNPGGGLGGASAIGDGAPKQQAAKAHADDGARLAAAMAKLEAEEGHKLQVLARQNPDQRKKTIERTLSARLTKIIRGLYAEQLPDLPAGHKGQTHRCTVCSKKLPFGEVKKANVVSIFSVNMKNHYVSMHAKMFKELETEIEARIKAKVKGNLEAKNSPGLPQVTVQQKLAFKTPGTEKKDVAPAHGTELREVKAETGPPVTTAAKGSSGRSQAIARQEHTIGKPLRKLTDEQKACADLAYTRIIFSAGVAPHTGPDSHMRAVFKILGFDNLPSAKRVAQLIRAGRQNFEIHLMNMLQEAQSYWPLPAIALQYGVQTSSDNEVHIGAKVWWITPRRRLAKDQRRIDTGVAALGGGSFDEGGISEELSPAVAFRDPEFDPEPEVAPRDMIADLTSTLANIASDETPTCHSANKLLGFRDHVSCAAHRLHLVVNDALLYEPSASLDKAAFERLGVKPADVETDRFFKRIQEQDDAAVAELIQNAARIDAETAPMLLAAAAEIRKESPAEKARSTAGIFARQALAGRPEQSIWDQDGRKQRKKYAKHLLHAYGTKIQVDEAQALAKVITKVKSRASLLEKSTRMCDFFHALTKIMDASQRTPPQNCTTQWTSLYRILLFEVRFERPLNAMMSPDHLSFGVDDDTFKKIKDLHEKRKPWNGAPSSSANLRLVSNLAVNEMRVVRELFAIFGALNKTNRVLQREHKSLGESYYLTEYLKARVWLPVRVPDEVILKVDDERDELFTQDLLAELGETELEETETDFETHMEATLRPVASLCGVAQFAVQRLAASLDYRFDRVPDDASLMAIILDPRYRSLVHLEYFWTVAVYHAGKSRANALVSEGIAVTDDLWQSAARSSAKTLRLLFFTRGRHLLYELMKKAQERKNILSKASKQEDSDDEMMFGDEDTSVKAHAELTKYMDMVNAERAELRKTLKMPFKDGFDLAEIYEQPGNPESALAWWSGAHGQAFPILKGVFAHVHVADATSMSTEDLFPPSSRAQMGLCEGELGTLPLSDIFFVRSNLSTLALGSDAASRSTPDTSKKRPRD